MQGHSVTCIAAHYPLTRMQTRAPLQNAVGSDTYFPACSNVNADLECLAPLRSLGEHSVFCSGISSPEIVSLTWLLVGLATPAGDQCRGPVANCALLSSVLLTGTCPAKVVGIQLLSVTSAASGCRNTTEAPSKREFVML